MHALRDIGDHRAAIAGTAAKLAAERAIAGDVRTLRDQVDRLRAAAAITERRRADARIHIEIAATAQSPRLTQQEMDLWSAVGDLTWLPVAPMLVAPIVAEHDALIDAIERQDPSSARSLAERHVGAETERMLSLHLELSES
jgi:DNA-binding FadR family transcriptional regulator